MHLEFETFYCLPAFTIVTNEFDSSLIASVEFVLGEEDLSGAPRAFLSHHTSNEVVQLLRQIKLWELLNWLVYKDGARTAQETNFFLICRLIFFMHGQEVCLQLVHDLELGVVLF